MMYSTLEIDLSLSDSVIPVALDVSDMEIPIDIELFGNVVSRAGLEDYEGPYEVLPLITTQILPTTDKHMLDDVTIHMIPTREVQNLSGGVTFVIGG